MLIYLFIGTLVFTKILTLGLRKSRDVDITDFPETCSRWAVSGGCTRIVWEKDGCVRNKGICDKFSVIFKKPPGEYSKHVNTCIERIPGG